MMTASLTSVIRRPMRKAGTCFHTPRGIPLTPGPSPALGRGEPKLLESRLKATRHKTFRLSRQKLD